MEVQGVDTKQNDRFPYSGIRVLGAVQAGTGALCALLGSLNLALTLIPRDEERQLYSNDPARESVYDTIVTITIASCPLWCGMWFIITGSIGTCVSRMRTHSLLLFRNIFLTLSILCAALFGPACLGTSVYESFLRHNFDGSDYRWLLPLIVTFLSVLEIVLAIISASVSCCCSPVHLTKVHVLFAPPSGGARPQEVYRIEADLSRRPTPRLTGGQGRMKALPSPEVKPDAEKYNPGYRYPSEASFRREDHLDKYGKLKKWALPSER